MKYRLSEIARLCGGRLLGRDGEVTTLSTDSRRCAAGEGTLFVAIRGQHHDAHRFVAQMVARGVKSFLVEHEVQLPEGCGQVVVERAIPALQTLASDYRSRLRGLVVAIAGSNGKTIIKEWLVQLLESKRKVFRSPKSYNSQLGVPLSILLAEGDEELILIEAGISKPGEMEALERVIRPDWLLFSNLGEAHQENFESLEEKGREKLILGRRVERIIYDSSSPRVEALVRTSCPNAHLIDAAHEVLDPRATNLRSEAERMNARLVQALSRALGVEVDLREVKPVEMRLELKEGLNESLLIDDAYSADLNSLRIALDYLHSVAMERPKTVVLSDIEQSGRTGEELYCEVARALREAEVDLLLGVGKGLREAAPLFGCESRFYRTTEELLAHLKRSDYAGRALLIKGSRASSLERVVHALKRRTHTTTLEIDLDAMVHNLNYFRSKLKPDTRLVAMVKASSYGAGDFEVAQMLSHQGVDYLAVAFADEGVLLRDRGITMPIVVLNADEGSFSQMIRHRLEPEIYSFGSLEGFVEAVRKAGERSYPIHLKLDTGMHRLGFMEQEIESLIDRLASLDVVRVSSIFSHLNCSDTPTEDDYTRAQIARFEGMSSRLMAHLPAPILRHTAQSAAIERFPEAHYDMCRLGLGLYGFGWQHNPQLRPVATLKSRIVQLKHLQKGDSVGYGRAGRLERDTLSATIPIGYADGLDRHLGSGRWSIRVGEGSAPILGRICMDSCMIDVTDIPGVSEGDEVTIFSPLPGNDLETMAHLLETIPYELMTSISSRVKRIYIRE